MIVSPAHCNFFSVASSKGKNPSSSCSLEVQVPTQQTDNFYQCPCHPNNNDHICSSSGNDNLRCTKSTVCGKCYKCDLKGTKNTFCYVSQVIEGQPLPKCSCEKTSCLPNHKGKKPGRYYKKRQQQP